MREPLFLHFAHPSSFLFNKHIPGFSVRLRVWCVFVVVCFHVVCLTTDSTSQEVWCRREAKEFFFQVSRDQHNVTSVGKDVVLFQPAKLHPIFHVSTFGLQPFARSSFFFLHLLLLSPVISVIIYSTKPTSVMGNVSSVTPLSYVQHQQQQRLQKVPQQHKLARELADTQQTTRETCLFSGKQKKWTLLLLLSPFRCVHFTW